MSTYAAKPSSKGENNVVVDLKPTKNFNRLETIRKVLKVASIILFLGAAAAFSFYLMGYFIPVIVPTKILLGCSIFGVTSSALLAFSQTIVEGVISARKACSSSEKKKSQPKTPSLDVSFLIRDGDEKAGMVHIMEKHVSRTKWLECSKFDSEDKDEIRKIILEGWKKRGKKPLLVENGKVTWEIDMERKIGHGSDTKPANKLIIVIRESDNYLISAYPRI